MYYPVKTFQARYLASDKPWNKITEEYRSWQDVVDDLARDILTNGMDFNFVTDDVLLKSSVKNGKMVVGSHSYSQLVMPKAEVIPLDVLKKVREIKAAGIRVHWVKALPQMGIAMEEHEEVKSIAGTLLTNDSPISDLRRIRYDEFSIDFQTSNYQLSMARFSKEGRRIYFVVNDSKDEITLTATSENVKGLKIYNPVDGSIKEASLPLSETVGGYESLLLVETVDEILSGFPDRENSVVNSIKLYPNPVRAVVNIEIPAELVGGNMEMYNAAGKHILSNKITSTMISEDFSIFNAGHYFIRIGGQAETGRILKLNH